MPAEYDKKDLSHHLEKLSRLSEIQAGTPAQSIMALVIATFPPSTSRAPFVAMLREDDTRCPPIRLKVWPPQASKAESTVFPGDIILIRGCTVKSDPPFGRPHMATTPLAINVGFRGSVNRVATVEGSTSGVSG